ncbi:hypothetical protein CKAN_00081400 [Cinnamomum micranthum f. kanehirae]|uniref:Uncharacterized protein n=1 Tax=Cinnamomum micranthum f. kanehirae TaxID=337451 RepID=A0A3S4N483_9MAGN|nr:hypothetical protein CKAN_00081400 [Cinnamomum micranthum f. kanehirae]
MLIPTQVLKANDVDLMIIARGTPGFSGADLANLVNIAALKAAMDGAKAVSMEDLDCFEIEDGESSMGEDEQRVAGRRLLQSLGFHKATIVPRGMSLGMVAQLPDKDETSVSRKQMLARLDVCMGGRVAEELIFGENEVTSGASSDLQQATSLARAMVTNQQVCGIRASSSAAYLPQLREWFGIYPKLFVCLVVLCVSLHYCTVANMLEQETLSGSQIKSLLAQVNSQQQQQQEQQQTVTSQTPPASVPPSATPSGAAAAAAAAATAAAKAKGVAQPV